MHSQIRPSSHRLADGSPWDDDPDVDSDRDGWPDDYTPSGSTIGDQLYNYSVDRLITLETELGGVMPLAYEVKYDPSDTTFESSESLEQDLLVIDIKSAIEHLDQERAEITFGIGIEGMPALNFSSAIGDIGDTLQEVFFDAVRAKLEELSDSLTGDMFRTSCGRFYGISSTITSSRPSPIFNRKSPASPRMKPRPLSKPTLALQSTT